MDELSQDWRTWTTADLLTHRATLFAALPSTPHVLRGSVVFKSIRCGQPSCHCARGGSGHPHYYLSSTVQGRTHLDYIPVAWIPWVQTQIDTYRLWHRTVITITTINRELFRRRVRDGDGEERKDS